MSEAYECDRCGGLNSGTPDTNVQVFDGESRTGPQDDTGEYREGTPIQRDIYDLCPGCRNDLRRWFREAGADVSFHHAADETEVAADE